MNGWEKTPSGWEFANGKYNIKHQVIINQKQKFNYDAIFVLAGGIDNDGNIHPWVQRRLDIAIDLGNNNDIPIVVLGGGTYHKPHYTNKDGFVIHESTACANYLIYNGIKSERIMREWSSYDTIANAFFGLTNFAIPRKWKHILIITSEFHMPRSVEIFKWIFGLESNQYKLDFIEASDENLDDKNN